MCLDIKDIITFGFTIWGLVIASEGLSVWKKQTRGVKDFDTAYSLNYSVLKLRNAIKSVRNPAIWPSESNRAVEYFKKKYHDRVDEPDVAKKTTAYVYEMRWEEITAAYTEMESHLIAAEVLWGPEIKLKIKPLMDLVGKLNIRLRHYHDSNLRAASKWEDLHDTVFDQSDGVTEDAFGQQVATAIDDISEYIKKQADVLNKS